MADCPHNICRLECSVWLSAGICICCKSDLFSYKTLPTFCGLQQLHNWKFLLILLTLVKVNLMKYKGERHSLSMYLGLQNTDFWLQTTTDYRLQTTDYRLQTAVYRLQTTWHLRLWTLHMICKYTNVYRIFWILDTNLIWPSRGKDVSPAPDWLLFPCISSTRMELF